MIGEPVYEVGAILRNLWPDRHSIADLKRTLRRRISQFAAELDIDPARIRGWGIAQAMLSAIWALEDGSGGGDWRRAVAIAETLSQI